MRQFCRLTFRAKRQRRHCSSIISRTKFYDTGCRWARRSRCTRRTRRRRFARGSGHAL